MAETDSLCLRGSHGRFCFSEAEELLPRNHYLELFFLHLVL